MMKIIGLSGRKQSGKDTLGEMLVKNAATLFPRQRVRRFAFAGKIKDIAVHLLQVPEEWCYGDEEDKGRVVEHLGMKVRDVLQWLGVSFRGLWQPVWVKKCFDIIEAYNPDVAIITDVRFPNEADAIRERGGKVVRLTREPIADAHESEHALDGYNFDAVIDNTALDPHETYLRLLAQLHKWGWIDIDLT